MNKSVFEYISNLDTLITVVEFAATNTSETSAIAGVAPALRRAGQHHEEGRE